VGNPDLSNSAANPFPNPRTTGSVGIGQQQRKLFSAVSRREIGGPTRLRGQRPRDRLQTGISGRMAILIVEFLEMIHIDH
jgi:hypothetical protein